MWNTGGHKIKLIGIAPKKADPDANVVPQQVNTVNTSDRNAVESVDSTWADVETSQVKAEQNGGSLDAEGSKSNSNSTRKNGKGASDGNGQLDVKVGSLNLTAPGTSRNNDDEAEADTDGYHQ